jgi:DNA-binding MarR family transcriptional regulator
VCLPVTPDATQPHPQPHPQSQRFGDLLALARLSWIRQIRAHLDEAGFAGYRRSDSGVLGLLAQRPLAIGQLGEALGITRQAARQLADGVVERGYASFSADPADARRTLVVLTPAGARYARAAGEAQRALNDDVRGRVSAADLAAATRVLRAVFPADQDHLPGTATPAAEEPPGH